MGVAEITLQIWVIVLGVLAGVAFGLAIRNYNELRAHRCSIAKLADLMTKLEMELIAKKLADQVTDMIFGEDNPEDLEKLIKEVVNKEGSNTDAVAVKGKKKSTKKSTKKETK